MNKWNCLSLVSICRFWRGFLNYQRTGNVLTAKASRYLRAIWIVLLFRRNNMGLWIVRIREGNIGNNVASFDNKTELC